MRSLSTVECQLVFKEYKINWSNENLPKSKYSRVSLPSTYLTFSNDLSKLIPHLHSWHSLLLLFQIHPPWSKMKQQKNQEPHHYSILKLSVAIIHEVNVTDQFFLTFSHSIYKKHCHYSTYGLQHKRTLKQGNTTHNIILCLGDASVETTEFGNQNIKTLL